MGEVYLMNKKEMLEMVGQPGNKEPLLRAIIEKLYKKDKKK